MSQHSTPSSAATDTKPWQRRRLQQDRAHSALMTDYYLGGHTNYPADRAAADQVIQELPAIGVVARENRAFRRRAIEPLASTIAFLARQEPNCPVAAAALAFLTFTNAEIARCRNSGPPDDAGTRQARWAADWVTLLRLPLRLAGLVLTLARPHPCRHPLLEAVRRHAGAVLQTMTRALSVTAHPRPVPLSRAVQVQFAAILCAASAAAEEQVGDANPVARARPDRRRAASP